MPTVDANVLHWQRAQDHTIAAPTTREFSWDPETRVLAAEHSTITRGGRLSLPKDLLVKSHHTGRVEVFRFEGCDYLPDGSVAAMRFTGPVTLLIFND